MKITKDMAIAQIVEKHPQVVPVFFKHGLGCLGCAIAQFETLEQGAKAHGLDVDGLLADLNKVLAEEK